MQTDSTQDCNHRLPARKLPHGFTLVELLVVIFIIGLLVAMLTPAIHMARESARKAACQNNLRQFGVGMYDHAQRTNDALSTGAFSWRWDGAVTEVGWVADLVTAGTPVGEMLCPSNPAEISETYTELLTLPAGAFGCMDPLGSLPKTAPDGQLIVNPCRRIITAPLNPGGEDRRKVVEQQIFEEHFNTNYTASWFLARAEVSLDSSGNLREAVPGCGTSLKSRNSTAGPLKLSHLDSAAIAPSFIPLLGCGTAVGTLPQQIGKHQAGAHTVLSFTGGPVLNPTMATPSFGNGTPREGASGWWAVWARGAMQDYRGFAPVHRGSCNVLFADGSVRPLTDENKDGFLNNGFSPSANNQFADADVELPHTDVESLYSLGDKTAHQ